MNRKIALAALLISGVVGGCDCEEDQGLLGLAPDLLLRARVGGAEAELLLPGPKPIVFPLVPVGDELVALVELENSGDAELSFPAAPSLLEGNTAFELRDVFTTACPGKDAPSGDVVVPGGCTALLVAFRPTAPGDFADHLVLRTNAPGAGELHVPLVAVGAASALVVCEGARCAIPGETLEIDFGNVAIGAQEARALEVRNLGSLALDLLPYVYAGSPEYGVAPAPEGRELAGLEIYPLTATFAPVVGGLREGTLLISGEGGTDQQITVRFTGRGDAPAVCVTPFPTVDFGEVVERTTTTQSVRIESCGSKALSLRAVALLTNGEYALPTGAPAAQTLEPGQSVDVAIDFTPPAAQGAPYPGRLKVESDAPGSETMFVALTGRGVPPRICDLQPIGAGLDFGQTLLASSKRADVVFQNLGADTCTIPPGGISLTGANGGLFRVVGQPPVPLTVGAIGAPNAVFRVTIEYGPQDGVGPDTATLVAAPAGAPPANMPLSGTPVDPADFPCLLSAEPASVQFGLGGVGYEIEEMVRLRNVGSEDCNVTLTAITVGQNAFRVASNALPIFGSPVPAGSFMDVKAVFRPQAEGLFSGNLRVTYTDGDPFGGGNTLQLDVPLAGEGRAPQLCVNPSSVDFGAIPPAGVQSRTLDLLNCGGVDLILRGVRIAPGSHPGFVYANPPLPAFLTPGQSQTVTITATATPQGAMLGALEVLSSDVDSPTTNVPLRANSQGCDRALVCRPNPVAFGPVETTTSLVRSIVCRNPGAIDVAINPSVPAPFRIVHAPASIAAGGVGAISVEFTPATTGAATAIVEIGATSCDGGPMRVTVNGTGEVRNLPLCIAPANFTPEVLWEWSGGGVQPQSHQVWASPVVSRLEDTDGDGVLTRADQPRVLAITFNHRDWDSMRDPAGPVRGILRALDGGTGAEIVSVIDPAYFVQSGVTPAVVDLDADGFPEIIAQGYVYIAGTSDIPGGPAVRGKFVRGFLMAFDHRGRFLWRSQEWTRSQDEIEDMGGLAVGDVDGDGFAEIAVGDHLFDRNGTLLWRGGFGTGSVGHGPISVLVDVDGQPGLELVAGNTVYRADGSVLWRRQDLRDGLPAVSDVDNDGDNEVVINNGELFVLNGQTGATIAGPRWPPTDMSMGQDCVPMQGQENTDCNIIPAAVAILDQDGDGDLEISVAARNVLLLYDHQLNEVWRSEISDQTGASGPTGFDFEGDGSSSVVYSDERHVYAYDPSGATTYTADHNSVTLYEFPAVVDLDNDGHANLVIISNEPMFGSSGGVHVYGNAGRSWVHARAAWNQHAYVEDLIGDFGTPLFPHGPVHGFRTATPSCR